MAMQWDIVSFGDVVVMQTVFNAIASISADSTYKAAAAAVALFVFAGAVIISLGDGKQEIPIPRVIMGFMLYAMGFSTLTTVVIENRYEGTVSVIDNIPIAIAVPASLISNIGFELSEITEMAFGSTNAQERITERGYLSPLRVIAEYKKSAMYSCPAGFENSISAGYKFCPSIHNYIAECTMVKAKKEGITQQIKERELIPAIESNSGAFGTKLILASGNGEFLSCKDAYDKVKLMFSSGDFDSMLGKLSDNYGTHTGETPITQASDVLQSIGLDAGKSRALMATIMANRLIEDAEVKFYNDLGASDYAENLMSSIEQRNYGWIMQGSMWTQIINLFISLMECLLYAMTPFIGLMVLCGSVGKKTLLIYLQMLAVIQLMPMLLVISQNIVMSAFSRNMLAISLQFELGSIAYTHALFEEAKEMLGLGGMIAATIVPAMAMTLVTGSGMAMMGAMKGAAATAKDTDAVPDLTKQGGSVQDWGGLNSGKANAHGDVWTQSGKDLVGTIGRQLSSSTNVSDARDRALQAQSSYATATENSFQNSSGRNYTAQEMNSFGQQMVSGSGTMNTWAENQVKSLGENFALSSQEKNELAGALAIGATYKALGAKGQEQYSEGLSANAQKAFQELTQGTKGEQLNASFQEAKTAAHQNNETVSTGSSDLDSKLEKVAQTRQESESASEKWTDAKTAQDTASFMVQNSEMAINQMGNDKNLLGKIEKEIGNNKDDENWMRLFSSRLDEFDGGVNGMDLTDGSAVVAAYLATNNELGRMEENQELLSNYDGNGPVSTDKLREINENNGIASEAPNLINYGEMERENIERPSQNSVPTEFKNPTMKENESTLRDDNSSNTSNVNNAANDFFERDGFKAYEEAINNKRSDIDLANGGSADIPALDNTSKVIKTVGDYMRTDGEEEGRLLADISNAYNAARDEFNDTSIGRGYEDVRNAYYESPIGQTEIAANEWVGEKLDVLGEAISGGNKNEIANATEEYAQARAELIEHQRNSDQNNNKFMLNSDYDESKHERDKNDIPL